jgi:hypothetical protein
MPGTINSVDAISGDELAFEMGVEVDEGVAKLIINDEYHDVFALVIEDPNEVDEFFKQMDELKKEWERVNWDGRRTAPGRVVAQGPGHLDRPNPA